MSDVSSLPAHAAVRPRRKADRPSLHIEPLALSVEAAAAALAIGRSKAWELIRDGQLQVVRIGGRTVVTTTELRRFVAALVKP
ncbi:helix-turn-helix domain-containing protein [Limobrevibacterium gyesilva]|uniref:Helix-turn-helix domain-containing protein n=1 Tax=Limobrevibacterium gyesilva TaxID=2991712 RepID=A0AA41YUJ2_9PROT|nr:helix-turn-helix domain-containing protein [Limobrevibacterium gyesilva]MCW3476755.1 helix-turn-helix domain-containing protein [Limobrevibacterium gyesilva]